MFSPPALYANRLRADAQVGAFIEFESTFHTLTQEATIAVTRCGPTDLSSWLERASYLAVFALVSASILSRCRAL